MLLSLGALSLLVLLPLHLSIPARYSGGSARKRCTLLKEPDERFATLLLIHNNTTSKGVVYV